MKKKNGAGTILACVIALALVAVWTVAAVIGPLALIKLCWGYLV